MVEVLATVVVLTVFFASTFQLNATCLRLVSASKENISSLDACRTESSSSATWRFRSWWMLHISRASLP